jgi:hypothetical protein
MASTSANTMTSATGGAPTGSVPIRPGPGRDCQCRVCQVRIELAALRVHTTLANRTRYLPLMRRTGGPNPHSNPKAFDLHPIWSAVETGGNGRQLRFRNSKATLLQGSPLRAEREAAGQCWSLTKPQNG